MDRYTSTTTTTTTITPTTTRATATHTHQSMYWPPRILVTVSALGHHTSSPVGLDWVRHWHDTLTGE